MFGKPRPEGPAGDKRVEGLAFCLPVRIIYEMAKLELGRVHVDAREA